MTAEPEVRPAVRGVVRVVSPAAPRVRAIAHVGSPGVRAAVPARARGAASVPWSPVTGDTLPSVAVADPPARHGSGPARGVAMVRDPSPVWRVRASVPPIVVARRAVTPGSTVSLDPAAFGAAPAVAEQSPVAIRPDPAVSAMRPVYVPGPEQDFPYDRRPGTENARDVSAAEVTPARVPKRSRARRALLPVSVAVAAGFVAATGYLAVTEPRPVSDIGRWSAIGAAPAPQTGPSWDPLATGNATPFGTAGRQPQGPPTRLRVAAIGLDTALESLHLGKDGALTPPRDFTRAGWYADGTTPGDQGPAVIAGHVDSKRGPAVFYRLRELQPGDRMEVVRGGEAVRFTVISTAWYPKTTFPTDDVYGPTPDRQLRLITCGGVFNHSLRSYKDNLVVYAVAG